MIALSWLPRTAGAQKRGIQQVLHVDAAADLQPVLPTLAAAYEAQTGVHLLPSFGSSATLADQIRNGAPQDLFLSADCAHPQGLAAAGLTSGEPIQYARGVLVLWARHDSPAQPLSLDSLSSPKVQRVAVANDLHAPYGQAATAALRALHLDGRLADKLVVGESIAQTAQFAQTGNAQAALISLTIASSPLYTQSGSFVRIPAVYPPIRQCGVVLRSSPEQALGADFLKWLTSAPVQHKLSEMGLESAQ